MMGYWLQTVRELADFVYVVVLFNVFSASGNSDTIEQFKKIKITVEACKQRLAGSLFYG